MMGFPGRVLPGLFRLWVGHSSLRDDGGRSGLVSMGLVAATATGLALVASPAAALEEIQLTYGALQSEPISMTDLESFAFSGTPSRDLELLLDILEVDEDIAQEFLTREIPIDFEGVRKASETFIGSAFWRLAGTAIALNDTTGEGWQQLRDALIDAAEDDRVTLLEVLQNIEAGLMVVDTQRLMALSSQVREDVHDIRSFFSGFGTRQEQQD